MKKNYFFKLWTKSISLFLLSFFLVVDVYSTEVKVINTGQYVQWNTHIFSIQEGGDIAAVKFNSGATGTFLVRFAPQLNLNQGTATGNLTVKLWTLDANGNPTTPVIISGPTTISSLGMIAGQFNTVTFQLNIAITKNTNYYIGLEKTGGTGQIGWAHDEANFGILPNFPPNPLTPPAYRTIRTPTMKSDNNGTTWLLFEEVITMCDVVVANVAAVAPSVSLGTPINITPTSAKLYGNLTSNGSNNCTEKGVVWSTSASPTTASNKGMASSPSTTGSYGVTISPTNSLTPATLYYFRPYATSLNGTSYSATDGTFRTTAAELTANPASFTLNRTSATSITLTFTAPGTITNCKGYIILRRSDGTNPKTDSVIDRIAPTSLNMPIGTAYVTNINSTATTSYINSSLESGQSYNYILIPYNWDNANAETYNYYITGNLTAGLPIVYYSVPTNITTTSATANGYFVSTNGANVTTRGAIVYPFTGANKIIGDEGVTNISETGNFAPNNFSASLTELSINAKYSIRAYAANSVGTGYADTVSLWTLANVPSAPSVDNFKATAMDVTINENLNPDTTQFAIQETTTNKYVQANGSLGNTAYWQTDTIWGTKTVTGLTTGTIYTFKVKARNGKNTETTFSSTTSGTAVGGPTITTQAVSNITSANATGNGNITNTGGLNSSNRGLIYYPYSNSDKEIGGADVTIVSESGNFGTGAFTTLLTGLSANTRYNERAMAMNSVDTSYGTRTDFWTLTNIPFAPTVNNPTPSTLDVTINKNGNPTITTFAIHEKLTNNFVQANGSLGIAAVWLTDSLWGTKTVTGLTKQTTYTFEVKAKNGGNVEGVYSTSASGTPITPPALTTGAVSNITSASATGNGSITDIGDSNPNNRGIIYYPYTNTDKIIGGNNVTNTSETGAYGIGAFFASLTGLSVNTHYNVRAHATNNEGVGYGSRVDFWTLASTPDAPFVNNPATTSLDLAINGNENPAITNYAIYDTVTGKFVQTNGTLGLTAAWQTEALWEINASNTAKTVTGLLTNSLHTFKIQAKNGDDTLTAFSGLTSLYTLASVPDAPTINEADTISLNVAINAIGNPNTTGFAIYERKGSKYVQANGTLGDSAVWQIETLWETDATNTAKMVTGLNPNTEYTFLVKARNEADVETVFSDADSLFTLANIPAPPTIFNPTATSLDVAVSPNGNPAVTEYAIQDSVNGTYVQSVGTLGDSAIWQTTAAWDTITVTGLSTGVTYYFRLKAKNGNDVETAFGNSSSAYPYALPIVTTLSASSIDTTFATGNGNVTSIMGDTVTVRGLVNYAYTGTDKLIGDADVTMKADTGRYGTGTFNKLFTGMLVNSQYSQRAFAENAAGISYGNRIDYYTYANVPSQPFLNNPTATSLDVAVSPNGNPAVTEYAIQDSVNGTYVQSVGTMGDSAIWQTTAAWDTITVTGLSTGVTYYFRLKAKNGNDVETAFGNSSSAYPYALPIVTTLSASSIDTNFATGNGNVTSIMGDTVTVRGLLNYAYTGTDKLIGDADVTMKADTGRYGTGTFSKPFTGMLVNSQYSQRAFAENAAGISYGNRIDYYTYANVPSQPFLNNPTATSLDVAVSPNGNPTATEYAIQDSVNGTYVQSVGTMGDSAVWKTTTAWGTKTITGLSTGVTYFYRVKARNAENVETAFGFTTAQNTCSNPTTGGSIDASQTICYSTAAAALSSISLPANYGGTLEYKWQYATTTDSTAFNDILSTDSIGHTPGILTGTKWFRRLARVNCKIDWVGAAISNVVKITVRPDFTAGAISTVGQTICYNGDPVLIGDSVSAGGGNNSITYNWQSSTTGSAGEFGDIATTDAATYDPPTGIIATTWFRRMAKDGICNENFTISIGVWKVTVDPTSVGGSISGTASITYGSSTGTMTLSGKTGVIQRWERKVNTGSWTNIANTNATYSETPTSACTMYYRVYVKSGVCSETYSDVFTVTVDKKALSITADNKTKNYDGLIYSPFTVSYSGFVLSESYTALGGSLSFGGTSVNATNIGSYTIIPSGQTSDNYNITYNNGTLNIYCAAIVNVANSLNNGYGTLRDAIANVCENGKITFATGINGQTITLTTGTLTIDKNIILDNSNHANGIIISGAGDNITINTGKVLTLASNSRITVSGAIRNNAGKTGLLLESGSSFIQNNLDLQATAKRYLDKGWHLFGTPFKKYMITMSTITPAGGSLQVKPYTNGTNWQPIISSSYSYLIPTTGYAIKPSANYTLSLSGNLYYSPLTPDYTNSLIYNGTSGTQSWNLMANPYTSYINWKLMGKTNINQTLYLWDNTLNQTMSPTTNAAYFRTYNAVTNVGVPAGTTPYIAPLQGFFVKANASNPKLSFPPSARTHSNSAYYKDASTEIVLRLKAETEEGADELVICSNTAAKQGFEEFDSEKMLTANPMELYSYAKTGEKLTINTIENTQTIIPLGINGMAGSKAKITAFALETSNQVYLEDRHKGKLISLSENTEYSFDFPTNELQGRFFIRFGNVNSPITCSDVKVFKTNNELNVIAQTGENIEQFEVYSLTGACLFKTEANSNMFTTSLDLATGVYMIRVKTNITTQNVKLNWK